jgi:DNA-binding NtrC family response regulator
VKKPPTVFIVDNRSAVLNSLETTIKSHGFHVQCYNTAAQFIAEQDSDQAGCVLVDPLMAAEGGKVLHWLHGSKSHLAIVLISGLLESYAVPSEAPLAQQPHEISALLTMVADGLTGSLSRQAIRERSR